MPKSFNLICACASPFVLSMSEADYELEVTRNALLKYAACPACHEKRKRREIELEQRREAHRINAELSASYRARRNASMIDRGLLAYDPNHSGANPQLWQFMEQNKENSCLLSSETGRCKSRILGQFALKALESRTVYYTTAAALCDKLAAAFTKKEGYGNRILQEIYAVDLLIIEDLGKEAMTEARTARFWQILDTRYVAHDQMIQRREGRRIYHNERIGWQVWISTNWHADDLIRRMGQVNGEPVVRRMFQMMNVWKG